MDTTPTDPLAELREIVTTCTQCRLHQVRRQAVFGRGNHLAPIMLVGEAPGEHEDEQGEPFVGKSGERLDRWLAAAGIPQDQVYWANVLKCRPPDNKFPDDTCPTTCLPYLTTQMRVVKPAALVLLGKQALQWVLLRGTGRPADPVLDWVGRHFRRRDLFGDTRISVIYHPAYILRNASTSDEEMCIATLATAWLTAQAKRNGQPPALLPFEDLTALPAPVTQARSLFREERRPL